MRQKKFVLNEVDIPRHYYNIMADLPVSHPPVLHPGTKKPIGPEDLAPLFPMELIKQEVSEEKHIAIPEPVLKAYAAYRPAPLFRAYELEEAIGTRSKIFYKYEGGSPAGSHKPNTAIPQAYYNAQEGVKRLATETGAGQWGSSLAYACQLFGLQCKVYMVRISFDHKPYRKSLMNVWGADLVASPSTDTVFGKQALKENPDTPGSLGIAISEAVEDAAGRDDTKYALGSVLNHVMLHQSIIGLEAEKQMELAGATPDVVIGCFGGGSNFAGLAFPYARRVINGEKIKIVAVEPTACPTLTRGKYAYDFGDTAQLTPLMPMYTLGHSFIPAAIHAGGLRYHGASPIASLLVKMGIVDAIAVEQQDIFEAAITFARSEGFIPAPESSHAIRAAIDAAKQADEEGKEKTILFNLSGHGHFDMAAYDSFLSGNVESSKPNQEMIERFLSVTDGMPEIK